MESKDFKQGDSSDRQKMDGFLKQLPVEEIDVIFM